MRYLLSVVLVMIAIVSVRAQADYDTVPAYKKTNKMPDFAIIKADSTWFTNKQLPEGKPVVIIYFSPECGHCQMTATEFVKDMDLLKNVELVWVSFHTPEQIGVFADNYKLTGYKNVVLGRDPNYYIPTFFKVQFTPFMAVYDKHGKLVNSYAQGTDARTIAKVLKQKSK